MVDFGANRPERPLAELLTKKLRPGDIYTHCTPGFATSSTTSGKREPGHARRAQARRDLRRRPRRRQLRLAHRRAGDEGGLPARFDLHRPPHRQHERRHEGHAQRDGQVPGHGHVARRRDPRAPPGIRPARSSSEELGNLSVGAPADVAVLRLEKGNFGFVDMYGARHERHAEADLRADAARRQGRLRPERHHAARLDHACRRTTGRPAMHAWDAITPAPVRQPR